MKTILNKILIGLFTGLLVISILSIQTPTEGKTILQNIIK